MRYKKICVQDIVKMMYANENVLIWHTEKHRDCTNEKEIGTCEEDCSECDFFRDKMIDIADYLGEADTIPIKLINNLVLGIEIIQHRSKSKRREYPVLKIRIRREQEKKMTNEQALEKLKKLYTDAVAAMLKADVVGDDETAAAMTDYADTLDTAIKAIKAVDTLADALTGTEFDIPCDDAPDADWCEHNCRWSDPSKQCWIRWAMQDDKQG